MMCLWSYLKKAAFVSTESNYPIVFIDVSLCGLLDDLSLNIYILYSGVVSSYLINNIIFAL